MDKKTLAQLCEESVKEYRETLKTIIIISGHNCFRAGYYEGLIEANLNFIDYIKSDNDEEGDHDSVDDL